jgi:hypothetical protein
MTTDFPPARRRRTANRRRRAMITKTARENWIETLDWDEVQEALAVLEREPDLVPDRAGVVKALEKRFGRLLLKELHEHPELFVQHPDGTWSLREDDNVVAFKPKDPPDGAA